MKTAGAEYAASLPVPTGSTPASASEAQAVEGDVEAGEGEGLAATVKKNKKKDKRRNKKGAETEVVDPSKSAIQLAREKFARKKAMDGSGKGRGFKATGANAGLVGSDA